MGTAVSGIATSYIQAERIVDALKATGFANTDISVLLPDQDGSRDFAHKKHTKAPEGAVTEAGTGGVVGGVLGWLAGIGALAIPGIGPFVAAGPIMAALSGAAAGSALGGVTGALVGLGIPEYEAKRYEGKLREGNILISVHSDSSEETDRAEDILERTDAHDISSTSESGPKGSAGKKNSSAPRSRIERGRTAQNRAGDIVGARVCPASFGRVQVVKPDRPWKRGRDPLPDTGIHTRSES